MNTRTIVVAAICGIVIGLTVTPDVSAGNLTDITYRYFDEELLPGQSLSINAARGMVIDDLTYAAEFEPCNAVEACKVFDEADLPDWAFSMPVSVEGPVFWAPPGGGLGLNPPNTGGQGPFWSGGATGFTSASALPAFMLARAAHLHMIAEDTGIGGTRTIDRHTVSYYFQMGFHGAGSSWAQFRNTSAGDLVGGPATEPPSTWTPGVGFANLIPEINSAIGGAGAGGSSAMSDMPTYAVAAPTAASRHFQSPHVIRNGEVRFTANGTTNAWLIVKGRTFEASNAPIVETATVVQ